MIRNTLRALATGRRAEKCRTWGACKEIGPLRPIRVNKRLAWPVAEIRRVLGVQQ